MFLKNAHVYDYKILKNLDISFNSAFNPTIFPLASLNGGGKSTFLQLLFILLNTSFDKNNLKEIFLSNMLKNTTIKKDKNKFVDIEIEHNQESFYIKFYLVNNKFEDFNILLARNELENEMKNGIYKTDYKIALDLYEGLDKRSIHTSKQISRVVPSVMNKLFKLSNIGTMYHKKMFSAYEKDRDPEIMREFLVSIIQHIEEKLSELETDLSVVSEKASVVYNNLDKKSLHYICSCNQETFLLYETNLNDDLLEELSEKIYLVAPSTQVFSFLDEKAKNTLFLSTINKEREEVDEFYDYHVSESRKILKNFSTYDFASPTLIIDSFKKARDKDFELAIENSNYKNDHLKNLKKDLDNFLLDKTISVNKDLTRVIFKIKGSNQELNPDDLSHGELKKLGLFIWLKYHNLNDAIVLMDELENGLHPDWQYSIIKDLEAWAPNNQFILATHSYEVCQALTPAHVSELNPKLFNHND